MKKITRSEFLKLTLTSSIVPFLGYGCGGRREETDVSAESEMDSPVFFENLGFQVYTLRDLLVDNAPSLFTALAATGIKNIEFFDPLTLREYVPIVNDAGLNPLATHFLPGYITGNWESARQFGMEPRENYHFENIVEDCASNGIEYAGIAVLMDEDRQTLDDYRRFAEMANVCGEQSRAAGVQLFYHNHSFEFEPTEGTTPYAAMLEIFDRELVKQELDVFWAAIAGQDPVQLLHDIADRLLFLHLKDLKRGSALDQYALDIPRDSFVELGDGMLDFESILSGAKELGITHAIIDQDETQMDDKIASVRKNCEYVQSLGI